MHTWFVANLLLVDDDHDMTEALAEVLTSEGHDVRVAEDGEQGLELLFSNHPDVVLCDVEMPVLDGPGMAQRVLAHNAGAEKIPLILLSGVADLRRLARELGTPYFLGKPYTVDQLLSVLDRALIERTPPLPAAAAR